MTQKTLKTVIILCAAFIYIIILLTTPLRRTYILKKAGKQLLAVHNKQLLLPLLIMIFSGALIALLAFKDMSLSATVIICTVAILGAAMGTEETALFNKCGVYENGLIGGGHFLPLKEIYALPVLSYTEEEQQRQNERVLRVTTDKRGTITFVYDTPEECKAVIDTLLSIAPDLKR
ncbi:hypothetical protein [uncultured Treponema sp.]|uniref:hypothetical protein n=1 Tax=uncultured Treponema sp. TaxID=162155 RepID=UPI002592AB24|nr:hypothetical protein [uncultured Treponema sp.]